MHVLPIVNPLVRILWGSEWVVPELGYGSFVRTLVWTLMLCLSKIASCRMYLNACW